MVIEKTKWVTCRNSHLGDFCGNVEPSWFTSQPECPGMCSGVPRVSRRPYNDQRVRPENGKWPSRHAIRKLDSLTSLSRRTDANSPSRLCAGP